VRRGATLVTAIRSPLVAVGESLAAGIGEFSLHARSQAWSFPAQMAVALGMPFNTPLFEPPGLDAALAGGPVVSLPLRWQSTVFDSIPPDRPTNLAVPGYRLRDALGRRPRPPMIHRTDRTQTACNLILGAVDFASGASTFSSQAECARRWRAALTIVCLGYQEAIDALIEGRPDRILDSSAFRSEMSRVLDCIGGAGIVGLCTVPNPADAAYCMPLSAAADVCCAEEEALAALYGFVGDELITIHGLHEIGFQLFGGKVAGLPPGSILSVERALQLDERVQRVNQELRSLATERGVVLLDLYGVFRGVSRHGVALQCRTLTADYLGGFFGLNGLYPGLAGHAVIANELMAVLHEARGLPYDAIDVDAIAAFDPVANYEPATGERWTLQAVRGRSVLLGPIDAPPASDAWPAARSFDDIGASVPRRLVLPPGREQVLPINAAGSYFGDGIGPVNCGDSADTQWGTGGEYLFGGLAMVDSHLHGFVRIRFGAASDGKVPFELSFEGGLVGDDAVLAAPVLFRMPFQQNRVDDVAERRSRGTLDLDTGEVTGLEVFCRFSSGALGALVGINPTFPRQPLGFPGAYGSAFARFEQRDDGLLDFTFYGSTFVPLGAGIRWPLNFQSVDGRFASVPANGTVMHPHLHLTTAARHPSAGATPPRNLPENEIHELTLHSHNSSFGDLFLLDIPQLGGSGKGRSHLLGRLHVQFGPRCGNSVPIAISALRPAGIFAELGASPVTRAVPSRLYPGPQGFDELLRFPTRTYPLDDLAVLDDPYDIAIAAIDLASGQSLNEVVHRGFIHQDLILALLRIETRTPKSSFYFRGPSAIETRDDGGIVYRFRGLANVPYPAGFLFPQPDLTTDFQVGRPSLLEPFLWLQAMQAIDEPSVAAEGAEREVIASTGDRFSYRYRIPSDGDGPATFEYENHSQQGTFRMHALTSAVLTRSRSVGGASFDTVSFSGFGVWRKDGHESVQQVAAQVSTSSCARYVGIQIDSGVVSCVNTKPEIERSALP
jgi:hypothetical protein